MTMSATKAIQIARREVSKPIGARTSWMLIGPYRDDDLDGPRTEYRTYDYWKCRATRTHWVAAIALRLMGWTSEEADGVTYDADGSVEDIVRAALKQGRD